MKLFLLLLAAAVAACAQSMPSMTTIQPTDVIRDSRGVINTNFTNLATYKAEGAASSTDNALARYNGTGGKLLQNSLVTLDDTGVVTIPNNVWFTALTSGAVVRELLKLDTSNVLRLGDTTNRLDGIYHYANTYHLFQIQGSSNTKLYMDTQGVSISNALGPSSPDVFYVGTHANGSTRSSFSDILLRPMTAPGTPTNGQLWYDTSLGKFRCHEGGSTVDCIGSGSGSGEVQFKLNGTNIGSPRSNFDIQPGSYMVSVPSDDGTNIDFPFNVDDSKILSRAQAQTGGDLYCAPASASGSNYTCTLDKALTAYTEGMVVTFRPDVNSSTGAVTLNIDGVGSANVKQADNTTDPGASGLVAGQVYQLAFAGTTFRMAPGGSGSGLGDPGSNGLVARTALNTTTARTATGTANEITVSNGDGVSGNPTFSIASTFDISGKTSTKPSKTGTTPPGTCAAGETFIDTDATAASQWLLCTSTDTWTAQGAGGSPPALNDLTDVTITSVTEDDAITYQGSAWVNRKAYVAPAAYSWRPAATTVMPGTRFYATDVARKYWVSDGTDWVAFYNDTPVTEPPTTGWTAVNSPNSLGTTGNVLTVSAVAATAGHMRTYPTPPFTLYVTMPFIGVTASDSSCAVAISSGTANTDPLYYFGLQKNASSNVTMVGYRFTNWSTFAASFYSTLFHEWGVEGIRLKIEDNNTNIIVSYWTGFSWVQLFSGARAAHFTPGSVGIGSATVGQHCMVQEWKVE